MSSKYRQGDRVHKNGIRGTIRIHPMLGEDDVYKYLVDWDSEWLVSEWVPEYDLRATNEPSVAPSWEKSCECGSKFTGFPDHHMFYCPLYKGK